MIQQWQPSLTISIPLAILIPAASVVCVGTFAIGLGVVFTTLYVNTPLKEWAVIALGMMLTVGVPVLAALLEWRMSDKVEWRMSDD